MLLVGCGGVASDAPEKCRAVHSALCARAAGCPGFEPYETCLAHYDAADSPSKCAGATGTGPRYDECIVALSSVSCADLEAGREPPACVNVIEGDN